MHALILGATGSSGRALVARLLEDAPSIEISAISRTARTLPGVAGVITGHYGDLAATPALRSRLGGVDAVVHLADGLSVLQQARPDGKAAALAGRLMLATERLVEAVREAAVPLFVYVSSIKALCDEDDERMLVEASAPRGTSLYGQCKLRLERRIAQALAGSRTRLVVVRNPVMYAPGKAGSMRRLLALADTAFPLPLGGLRNRRSLLAVRNLASALSAIVRAGPDAAAGIFHVHDGPALSTTEIVAILRSALGRPRRLFDAGSLGPALARRIPLIAPIARRLYGSLEMSDAAFREAFSWTPVVETRAALAEMGAAYGAARGADVVRATAARSG